MSEPPQSLAGDPPTDNKNTAEQRPPPKPSIIADLNVDPRPPSRILFCKGSQVDEKDEIVALQPSDDPSSVEKVYRRALSLAMTQQAHAILPNRGNLYHQQKRFEHAKAIFKKSLEICPGYSPSCNNLGLVFVAEGRWEEARNCFEKALQSDPLLDAAKSNLLKATSLYGLEIRIC